MLKLRHLAVAVPLTAILWGCGPEDMQDAGSTKPQSEAGPTLGTATQELGSVGAYSWASPADATSMGSTANRVCFLDRIQGNFVSGSSAVDVFASGGSFYLKGSGDTRATARCAGMTSANALSGEYTWKAAQALPTNMGTATGRVCFLVRVSGSFAGSADWARVYVSGGSWFLFGNSQKGDGGAQARCVTVPSYSGEYSWNSTQSYDTHMGATAGRVCALTYMGGRFDVMGDYIDVYGAAGSWYLGGAAASGPVYAKSRCF
ncbi:hypothetical protein [Archangium sp.]|uniref:hypothetical protein n=1 Tax=Archangium sp. TaxID=1872627 RepID=UPI002D6F0672|nr:hypothetical protein [Archangium sp.]HYO57544.1 hypothetical protein [Archangium sp.]